MISTANPAWTAALPYTSDDPLTLTSSSHAIPLAGIASTSAAIANPQDFGRRPATRTAATITGAAEATTSPKPRKSRNDSPGPTAAGSYRGTNRTAVTTAIDTQVHTMLATCSHSPKTIASVAVNQPFRIGHLRRER